MQLTKLLTLSFGRNVGFLDRVLRTGAGTSLIALPWIVALPVAARYGALAAGTMLVASGLLGRCSLYYLLGFNTCPNVSKENFP